MTRHELALVTCRGLGIRDPAELYALPSEVVADWMEFHRRELVGWYQPKREG